RALLLLLLPSPISTLFPYTTLFRSNPDLKGIFGSNEGSAIGVANGKQELNSDVVVIGFDSGAAQKGMVESGLMNGAITQNPVGIDRKSTRLNSSHVKISYAVFCLKK